MPRLFDLLPDDAKKGLADDAQKAADGKATAAASKSTQSPTPQSIAIPDFVAVDVETTGLDFKHDRVIEIGAVRFVDGKPEKEFSTFINAGVPIPDHITRLTKITDDDVRPAPKFADIAMELLEFIGSLPICGHQTEFDLTFINEELRRAAFPDITPQIIDTALMSRILLQHVGRYSLKHACAATGVTLENAHRALHDAKASGELAVKLIPMLGDLPLEVRQALAAFAPGGSMFKTLAIRSLFGARYGVNLKMGEPLPALLPKVDTPEYFLEVDRGQIEKVFSGDGGDIRKNSGGSGDINTNNIGGIIKGFMPRPAQKEMALNVVDALNDNGILVAEAGTGTGKSLAYLVPAAFHALKNNCRVVVSTHTRNLQDQLINKDLPAAAAICGGTLRYAKLKGRGNYLCRNRFYKLLRGEMGNLSPRERNAVLPLIAWSQNTVSGEVEEQTFFNPKWFFKTWNMISADSQDCAGRRCPYNSTCFLRRARQLAQTSHIVVINHALFYSDICSETSFLGDIGSIIFDEAHHLESSGHQHLRTELDTNRTTAFVDKLQNLLQTASAYKDAINTKEFEKELKGHLKHLRKRSQDLLHELDKWARTTAPESEADYQIPVGENSLQRLLEPAVFDITLGELQDAFHQFRQVLSAADKDKVDELREVTAACAEQTSQLRADLQYLVAAKTDDHVFWLEGNHEKKWTKLCGVPLDISELLAEIWGRCSGGIVFTSATLATSGSTDYFKRAAGLEKFADKTTSIILPSPYGNNQMLFGAFRTCPEPDNPAFPQFAAEVIAGIHSKLGKNILVLFTSNAMLNNVYSQLKSRPDVDRNNLLAQGFAGNRNSMLEEFKAQSGMILLGTDSFWEGVDAPGEACEAVIIPRLPFPVPSHPLTQALGRRMEALHGSSFFSYSVPEAIIKFRQGTGRLIRSASDRGVLAVLDNRILTKGYGKQFSRSVGSPINEFNDVDGMIERAREFFDRPLPDASVSSTVNTDTGSGSNVTYVPFEDI
ncbi:MAG: exonuclease domain-containing protein [Chitinispirillia bacterium]|nr:exonuclease domain-containing protein [Chitinispirillia bacterium]MCL2268325.1 exonuclease domain-containing protein [Chitinispirillia bacterium]